ncbi:MAG: MFS transporter, partial [Neisseria elongata]
MAATPSRWLPLLLAVCIFMQMLDATVLNTALPQMAADLQQSPLNMQSAVISYALTLALFMPMSGYLTDRYGTKKVFSVSMALFVLGSLMCAAAPNLPLLVFARVVQGMGGAMMVPVTTRPESAAPGPGEQTSTSRSMSPTTVGRAVPATWDWSTREAT